MPEYVRVFNRDTGYESTVITSTVHLANYDVLTNEPAVNRNGDPLPATRREPSPEPPAAPESLSSKEVGQKATNKKES